mmetsp:Transcript_223/g.704  ORF Transcript_223/g.704 Transcript_223/m.704 type:complete len:153 (+) Transcript_223:1-459(+)
MMAGFVAAVSGGSGLGRGQEGVDTQCRRCRRCRLFAKRRMEGGGEQEGDEGESSFRLGPEDLPESNQIPTELTLAQQLLLKTYEEQVENMSKEECHKLTIEIVRQMMTKENLIKSMFQRDDIDFGSAEIDLQEYMDKPGDPPKKPPPSGKSK